MIRVATREDLPEIAALWVDMVKELKPHWDPNQNEWTAVCLQLMDTGLYEIKVCVKDSRIVGFLDGLVFFEPAIGEKIGFGKSFYVMPEFRDTDIATRLYLSIIKFAKGHGANVVEIYCLQEKLSYWENKGFGKTQLVLRRRI